MAQIHILIDSKVLDLKPKEIELVANWKEVIINFGKVAINDDAEVIRKWLKPHSPIWLGDGPPLMQNFKLTDIKD